MEGVMLNLNLEVHGQPDSGGGDLWPRWTSRRQTTHAPARLWCWRQRPLRASFPQPARNASERHGAPRNEFRPSRHIRYEPRVPRTFAALPAPHMAGRRAGWEWPAWASPTCGHRRGTLLL